MRPILSNHLCDASRSQLVVIDIQARLAAAMAERDRERVVKHASALIQGAGLLDIPIVASEQYPRGLGPTLEGVAWHFPANITIIDKTCFSCGGNRAFRDAIAAHDRQQVVLTGMESHICVLQTALELQADGYQLFVAADAVCSRDSHHHNNALQRLQQAGVVVSNTESILFEWLRDANHQRFKDVSALIK